MFILLPSATGYRFSLAQGCKCAGRVAWHCLFLWSIKCTGISQPYRIDIFEDYIYGTGLKHEVFKIHKYGKHSAEYLSLGVEKPTNVLISHRYKQQDGKFIWKLFFIFSARKLSLNGLNRILVQWWIILVLQPWHTWAAGFLTPGWVSSQAHSGLNH